jgi:predicted RNase H-like HicB family nuclease
MKIGALRVFIYNDDGSYFAQGLELDYFAQGESLEDVKARFFDGLLLTLDASGKNWHGNLLPDTAEFKEFYRALCEDTVVAAGEMAVEAEGCPFDRLVFYQVERQCRLYLAEAQKSPKPDDSLQNCYSRRTQRTQLVHSINGAAYMVNAEGKTIRSWPAAEAPRPKRPIARKASEESP